MSQWLSGEVRIWREPALALRLYMKRGKDLIPTFGVKSGKRNTRVGDSINIEGIKRLKAKNKHTENNHLQVSRWLGRKEPLAPLITMTT